MATTMEFAFPNHSTEEIVLAPQASGVVLAAFVALAGLSGCEAIGDDKTTTRRESFGFSGKTLTISAATTDVRIVTGEAGAVGVEAQLTGKTGNNGNATMSLTDSVLKLNVECSGVSVHCKALHIVKVPGDVAVTIDSADGAVRVVDLAGPVTANASDGWVKVERPSGPLILKAAFAVTVEDARSAEVEAVSAERDVSLAFASAPQNVKATALGSSVQVRLPKGPETYRLVLSGTADNTGNVANDPQSKRSVTASVRSGSVDVRTAD